MLGYYIYKYTLSLSLVLHTKYHCPSPRKWVEQFTRMTEHMVGYAWDFRFTFHIRVYSFINGSDMELKYVYFLVSEGR